MKNKILHPLFIAFFCLNAAIVSASVPEITNIPLGATLDNGCSDGSNGTTWHFEWSGGGPDYEIIIYNALGVVVAATGSSSTSWDYTTVGTFQVQDFTISICNLVLGGGGLCGSTRTFTVEPINTDCPPVPQSIISATNGQWNVGSTWVGGLVPRSIDDVTINHTVDNSSGTGTCNNLTVNASKRLDQRATLIIGGNLTINGTFNHAYDIFGSPSLASTQIGAASVSAAAGTRLVTVAGTMYLGNNVMDGGFFLAGRMTFASGSTLDLQTNMNLTLTGWSEGTPQYLMDIDLLTTLNANINALSNLGINVTRGNGTHPVISTGRNFVGTSCSFNPTPMGFNLSLNGTYYFGEATRRSIKPIISGANSNLYLTNTTMARLTTVNGNTGSVHSTGGQFSNLTIGDGTTLYGDFTMIDDCNPAFPVAFSTTGFSFFDNAVTLTVNVTNSLDMNIPTGYTQKVFSTLNAQSGKMIVKGGTLDLRGSGTVINGLSNTRYFETQVGTGIYGTLGSVLLPSTGASPVNFNLGITIPSPTGGAPSSVFAPVNIVSNVGDCNVFVNLQPLTVPAGFTAPRIQWDISPVPVTGTARNLTMIFTWPLTAETYAFSISRANASVHHWNGTVWEPLVSEPAIVDNVAGTVSMRVQNVTSFSPFMIAVPNAALTAELVDFKAKTNGDKTTLTWQTASEVRVKNFDVEKSLDGKTFEKINVTKANNTPSHYSTFDNNFTASSYYRLKINDLDGTNRFSKIVYLEKKDGKSIKITRYTEGSLSVETDDKIELITVSNTVGQILKSSKDKQISVTDLNAGMYLISVKTDKGFVSQKVFKN